jgi:hypothetical protein
MARKLKTFETSLGFFDLAIAAPSMKAALDAWGAESNLFHQGAAKQSQDRDVIAATMAAPGVVLKRPVGSTGPFKERAELPTDLAAADGAKRTGRRSAGRKPPERRADPRAALALEKEQKRRERASAKEEATRQKERKRRQAAVDKAQSALDAARREHEQNAADIQAALDAIEEKSQAELARWEREKKRLEAALRRARGQ